jgi:hypothetical protein
MPSKWEGVPINMVPVDERECERTRREEQDEKKRLEKVEKGEKGETVPKDDYVVEGSSVDAMVKMNAPSIFSRGLHSGMMSKSGAQRVNKKRVPDSPMGTQLVAKQERDRPTPILQSKEDERLRKELEAARKQIELDEQDKEALRETIEEQKKKIADLESRPIVTEEMQLELALYHRAQQKRREREKRFVERHSKE